MALVACAALIGLLLTIRVIGQPTVRFAHDLWDWAAEQGVVGKLIYIAAWIMMMPGMLAFCVGVVVVLSIAERRRGSDNT